MTDRIHYEDVPGVWPDRRSRETVIPDGDLRDAVLKQGAAVVEPESEKAGEE